MIEPSLQYQLYKAYEKLQERTKMIEANPRQYWSGRITAFFRMRAEILFALFKAARK
jgi:hypothetical protein